MRPRVGLNGRRKSGLRWDSIPETVANNEFINLSSRLRQHQHPSRPALRSTQPPVNEYLVLLRRKVRPGRDADPSSPSSAEVKNRVELYLYSP